MEKPMKQLLLKQKLLFPGMLSLVFFSCNKDPVEPGNCGSCEISIIESVTSDPYYYTKDSFLKYHPGQEWCSFLDSLSTSDTLTFYDFDSNPIANGVKSCH
jgi:hypothetical protein